jgi:hypothetical protein
MVCSAGRLDGIFNAVRFRRKPIAQPVYRGVFICTVSAALLCGAEAAHSGPCTAQIAQLEQQISVAPSPDIGPTGPQTLGAQLHHQPTPGDVAHAERAANKDADDALDRARKADAAGDTAGCRAAISEAKRLYGID